jgi:hypothetical protein
MVRLAGEKQLAQNLGRPLDIGPHFFGVPVGGKKIRGRLREKQALPQQTPEENAIHDIIPFGLVQDFDDIPELLGKTGLQNGEWELR